VLIGRVAERRELHGAAMRAAAEHRGWIGLVGGEPGIGKTRLAAACAGQLAEDGFGVAWVSCPEDDGAPSFWVWAQLLGQLGADRALRAEAGEADPELARFLLFDAVAAGIREAAANRPLLLVVDDLQWADPGSRRLLAAIRGCSPPCRWSPWVPTGTPSRARMPCAPRSVRNATSRSAGWLPMSWPKRYAWPPVPPSRTRC